MITKEEYEHALSIVNSYEQDKYYIQTLTLEKFKDEVLPILREKFEITDFKIVRGWLWSMKNLSWSIYITEPFCHDEDYSGEYDDIIEEYAKKYDLDISMDPSQYGK